MINGTHDSQLLIGESIRNLKNYVPTAQIVVITDTNVNRLYNHEFNQYKIIEIGCGEEIKTLATVEYIYEKLTEYEVDRSWFLVGIGGGIVCDITGFVASTYMRGLQFGFVATTLLAQVDASVGGKNGVNFKGYKNTIGVFNQPNFVICDMELLKTLPEKEVKSGFGEIVKHSLIADGNMFMLLENNYEKALALDKDIIEKMVLYSVVIKSGIVNKDEKERGERRKLNFGHTIGHAIEKCTDEYTHGEAISIGMLAAAALSQKKQLITIYEYRRIKELLQHLKLPTDLTIDKTKLMEAMKHDKKRESDVIHIVLLNDIGNCSIEKLSVNATEEMIKALKEII